MARRVVSLTTTLKAKLPRNARLLVAVSAGRDSMALLHAAHSLHRLLSLHLEVAHVDHGLRGSQSAADAELVRQTARRLNLPFHLTRLKPPKVGSNIESWGRRERYAFFKQILSERKLEYVVTAHHSDDVAETFLMRLLSNKELRSIHARNKRHSLLRPLLAVSRASIDRYVSHYRLPFSEDESNASPKFLRNRVRHGMLAGLKNDFHPRVSQWIAERALVLDEDSRALDLIARRKLNELHGKRLGSKAWRRALEEEPSAVALRIVEFAFLERLKFRLGRNRARMARKVFLGQLQHCDLPQGWRLLRQGEEVSLVAPDCGGSLNTPGTKPSVSSANI